MQPTQKITNHQHATCLICARPSPSPPSLLLSSFFSIFFPPLLLILDFHCMECLHFVRKRIELSHLGLSGNLNSQIYSLSKDILSFLLHPLCPLLFGKRYTSGVVCFTTENVSTVKLVFFKTLWSFMVFANIAWDRNHLAIDRFLVNFFWKIFIQRGNLFLCGLIVTWNWIIGHLYLQYFIYSAAS